MRRRVSTAIDKILASTQLPQNVADIDYAETVHSNVKWMEQHKRRLSLISFVFAGCIVVVYITLSLTFRSDATSHSDSFTNGEVPDLINAVTSHQRESEKLTPLLNAQVFEFETEADIPSPFWEPCRRISQEEFQSGFILGSFRIQDILLTMCRALHDFAGCDKEDSIPTKMLRLHGTDEIINVCLIVHKPKHGDCNGYINPIIHSNPNEIDLRFVYRHKSFPYLGIISSETNSQILLTHHDEDFHPKTLGISLNQSIFVQHSYDIMHGTFPPRHDIHPTTSME
jgi:hypothetical protein